MDDTGFQDSSPDQRPTGGLIRRFLLAARIILVIGSALLLAVTLAGDRFLLTEWLGHIHPFVWFSVLLFVVIAWMPRWIGIPVFGIVFVLLLLNLHREQPNIFRLAGPAAKAPSPDEIRLSFWNVMSFNRGFEGIADGFLADDADIVCLVEGTYQGAVHDSLSRSLGDDYKWMSVRQMAVGTRLPILRSRELPTRTSLRLFEVRVLTADGPMGILLADLPRPPRLNSRAIFLELRALVATAERPFILVGDFNTARGSSRLNRATDGLTDFYLHPSSPRWLATFHDSLPLWQIDHAYATPGIHPTFAAFGERGASNHLRLRIGFTLEESAPEEQDQAFAPEPD